MIDKSLIKKCQMASKKIRIDIIKMTYAVGNVGAHIGGALSMVEIMSALYLGVMKYDVNNPSWERRDRFILSKGHGVMAQYAALKEAGFIGEEDLLTFKKNETQLFAHPSINIGMGVEFSSGSLGQGLSLGVGTALALKRKSNEKSKVFVLLGDGECDEGSVWEAAACSSHYKLSNLVAIVDKNNLQYDGPTEDVLSMESLEKKWADFGWNCLSVNGHCEEEILNALNTKCDLPLAIIANTIKGKGVSFMENDPTWHNNHLTKQQFCQAMEEQGVQSV